MKTQPNYTLSPILRSFAVWMMLLCGLNLPTPVQASNTPIRVKLNTYTSAGVNTNSGTAISISYLAIKGWGSGGSTVGPTGYTGQITVVTGTSQPTAPVYQTFAATTQSSTTVLVSNTSNLATGMTVCGAGISGGVFTGTLTSGSPNITSVAPTSPPPVAGETISGPNIPSGTTVSSFSGSTIVMSQNATANATAESFVCQTTITGISANTSITLSNTATASASVTLAGFTTAISINMDEIGDAFIDYSPLDWGDATMALGPAIQSGSSFAGSTGKVDITRESQLQLLCLNSSGSVNANVTTIASQTVSASSSITVPAVISGLTLSGGGTSVQSDASGYLKISNGSGPGQLSLVSGGVALQASQVVASVSGSVGSVAGSVASVSGDVGGKVLGGGVTSFSGNGVQVDKTGFSLATAPPTAAAIRTEMDSNSTQLAKLGTPAGASVSADIAALKSDTGTILTHVPNILPSFPSNFPLLAINGTGYVTATNGGGGGSSGLSSDDIAAIWAYPIPNTPAAGSVVEQVKNKLVPMAFDGANNLYVNVNAISNTVKDAIAADVFAQVMDGSINFKQAQALQISINTGKYVASGVNTSTHTQTVTYYRQDNTTTLAVATVTYGSDNKTITGRTVTFSNLP